MMTTKQALNVLYKKMKQKSDEVKRQDRSDDNNLQYSIGYVEAYSDFIAVMNEVLDELEQVQLPERSRIE